MYGTYQRLGVHVHASNRDVIRAASLKLKPHARFDRSYRQSRHDFYRTMLKHHRSDQKLVAKFRL